MISPLLAVELPGGEGTNLDAFESGDLEDCDGAISRRVPRVAVNERKGLSAGAERVLAYAGGARARIRDNDTGGEGLARPVDLSHCLRARLAFQSWR